MAFVGERGSGEESGMAETFGAKTSALRCAMGDTSFLHSLTGNDEIAAPCAHTAASLLPGEAAECEDVADDNTVARRDSGGRVYVALNLSADCRRIPLSRLHAWRKQRGK